MLLLNWAFFERKGRDDVMKSKKLKAFSLVLTVFLVLLAFPAFAQEQHLNNNMKVDAIINLEGIEPADQIINHDGVLEMGSNNVVDSVVSALAKNGAMSLAAPSQEPGAEFKTINAQILPAAINRVINQIPFENPHIYTPSKLDSHSVSHEPIGRKGPGRH